MVVKILTSLGRLGYKISVEEQKWVYFDSAKLVYDGKLYEAMKLVYDGKLYEAMKPLLKNPMVTLAQSVEVVETGL